MQNSRIAAAVGGTLRWLAVEKFADSRERDERYYSLQNLRANFLTRHGHMELNQNNIPVAVFAVTYDASSIPAEEAVEKEAPGGKVD